MNKEEAAKLWDDVVLRIRVGEAKFQTWRSLRKEMKDAGFREFANNLLRGFSQGLIDYATYAASDDAIVVAPRMKIPDADFIFIYKTEDGYDYFGIKKEEGGQIIETTKSDVKLGFAGILSTL